MSVFLQWSAGLHVFTELWRITRVFVRADLQVWNSSHFSTVFLCHNSFCYQGVPTPQQSGKKNKKGQETPKGPKTPGGDTPQKKVLEGGVSFEDVRLGNGPVAKPGREVSLCSGWGSNCGTDSSLLGYDAMLTGIWLPMFWRGSLLSPA